MRRRNTQAFTFLAWISFVCTLSGMLIGIYTLDETFSAKGSRLANRYIILNDVIILYCKK